MILRKEPEIRERLNSYKRSFNVDGQTEEYYDKLKTAIDELKWILGESG